MNEKCHGNFIQVKLAKVKWETNEKYHFWFVVNFFTCVALFAFCVYIFFLFISHPPQRSSFAPFLHQRRDVTLFTRRTQFMAKLAYVSARAWQTNGNESK